jgi:hypothetical protein
MNRTILMRAVVLVLMLATSCRPANALGEETFGNAPLNEVNYKDWLGIVPVVNHTSRVYYTWVNGNEHFYYQGNLDALNDTLRKFAQEKAVREVILRPGPGMTQSFDGTKKISFGWSLHLVGGISRHLTTLEQGDKVWRPNPVLTIYVGGDTALEKVVIPQGMTVLSLAEVKKRTREGLKSSDKTVRGWGCGVLTTLDPYDMESRDAIAGLLQDADDWVRLNAVLTLAKFGKQAQPVLPQLRNILGTGDAALNEQIQKSILEIEQAGDKTAAEREHRKQLTRIERFLSRRKR